MCKWLPCFHGNSISLLGFVDFSFASRIFAVSEKSKSRNFLIKHSVHKANFFALIMSKFEDLFGKKKEAVPVLDLSKSTATTKEEFKKLMEKVPDFKMRPVKVRPEEIKIKEKDCKEFKLPKKELRYLKNSNGEREKQYVYMDPVPTEMRYLLNVKINCTFAMLH